MSIAPYYFAPSTKVRRGLKLFNIEMTFNEKSSIFKIIFFFFIVSFSVEAERRSVQRQRTQHQDVSAHVLFVLCPLCSLLLQGLCGSTSST